MKKLIIIIVSLAVLVFLGWYTMKLMKTEGVSDKELIEFNIEDTASVNKIIVTDAFSNKIELIRDGNRWTDENGGCITQENVAFILEALKNIEFKGYLPDNSHKQFIKMMSAQNTKVEIFQNGEWTKTWYIGPPAADHYGQIMLLDSDEFGKSDIPVMMKIKGLQGIIEPRFFADKRKWMCTNIFAVPLDRISSVEIKHIETPQLSFKVTKKGNKMNVYQAGKKLPQVDTAMIYRYLQEYKKVHFELANYELDNKQIDSLKRSKPFATLTLKETNGKVYKLRMFRIKSEIGYVNEFGEVVNNDNNKFWCELTDGTIVKCQYFVFNRLILGHVYFKFNMAGVDQGKGK